MVKGKPLKKQEKKWVSIPTFAKMVGKTPEHIRNTIKDGKITPESCKKTGKRISVNPALATIDLENNTSHINKKPIPGIKTIKEFEQKTKATGTKGMSLADAQKLQAQYKAALLKLEYDEKSGALTPMAKVKTDFFNIARTTRDAILNVPARISAELASMSDVHLVSEKLTAELIAALEELSL